ncbi:unnamed protein product [Symbiodinium sp. CCMP2592]|nr:unnamed protein product [Symbiodinium sp. CCMP2592]
MLARPRRSHTGLGLLLAAAVCLLGGESASGVGFSVVRPANPARETPRLRTRHGRRSCAAPMQVIKAEGSGIGSVLRGFLRRALAVLSMLTALTWWGRSTSKVLKAAPVVSSESNDWEPEISAPVAVRSVQVPVQVQEAPVQKVAEMNQVAEATNVDTIPVAPVASEEVLTDPVVPGMAKANLVVNVETVPGKAQTPHADAKMQQSDQQVLENLCGDGWSCSPIDAEKGLFEITLPAVRYELPMGVVSIPAPLFHAQARSSQVESDDYSERLVADIVLQNGDKMLCVELGFPFNSKFTISAAGWARCRVGREPGSVICKAQVEMGLQVPKVPGLTSILQFFVKSYANKSAHDCAVSLSKPPGL